MKCQTCNIDEPTWAWQPFGPHPTGDSFQFLGSHYRGFPVIKVCVDCKKNLQNGAPMEFNHKQQRYIGNTLDIKSVPNYVSDALLYWEEAIPK